MGDMAEFANTVVHTIVKVVFAIQMVPVQCVFLVIGEISVSMTVSGVLLLVVMKMRHATTDANRDS